MIPLHEDWIQSSTSSNSTDQGLANCPVPSRWQPVGCLSFLVALVDQGSCCKATVSIRRAMCKQHLYNSQDVIEGWGGGLGESVEVWSARSFPSTVPGRVLWLPWSSDQHGPIPALKTPPRATSLGGECFPLTAALYVCMSACRGTAPPYIHRPPHCHNIPV